MTAAGWGSRATCHLRAAVSLSIAAMVALDCPDPIPKMTLLPKTSGVIRETAVEVERVVAGIHVAAVRAAAVHAAAVRAAEAEDAADALRPDDVARLTIEARQVPAPVGDVDLAADDRGRRGDVARRRVHPLDLELRATLVALIGSPATVPPRVLQTFWPYIGQSPASLLAQSRVNAGVLAATVVDESSPLPRQPIGNAASSRPLAARTLCQLIE